MQPVSAEDEWTCGSSLMLTTELEDNCAWFAFVN